MRVNQIDCPKCGSSLKSKAGVPVGQSLSCPKCNHRFTVQAPDEPDLVDDAEVIDEAEVEERPSAKRKSAAPPPARRRAAEREDYQEDEDEPRPKNRRPPEDRKRRREDDSDEEDRPRKKKRRREPDAEESLYWRLRHNIALRIIVWVVLLTTLAVVSYLFYEYKIKNADQGNSSLSVPAYAVSRADLI